MRPSLVVSLLLLSLLLSKVQGIRWEKGSVAGGQQKQQEEETMLKPSNSGLEDANLCEDGKCTGRIMKRKLATTSISTTHALSKNVKDNERDAAHPLIEENIKDNALATSKHRELPHEHYPDLVDIAEMDYSVARRKPPIHN